ncbi:hypothetical protein PENTCL1PPCAC_6967, partial [Pristionchus entomophagus]
FYQSQRDHYFILPNCFFFNMLLLPLLISSFSVFTANAQVFTADKCLGKSNLCKDQAPSPICADLFPLTGDTPIDKCFDATLAASADLCHKTCRICCYEPCVDVNPRCSVWTDGFCTNNFYSDEQRWEDCRKK